MFPMSLWSFYANGGGNGAELQEFIAQNNGMGAFQDLLTGTMGKKGGGGGSNNGPKLLRASRSYLYEITTLYYFVKCCLL
ncbi:hypothetical protein [Chryseobacterium sp. 22458]|uniref:hypothetical protein n=1 Tax=Chryseobacterium sp. 22458 TaxID=3453921 RepID=UPI003F853CFA